MTSHAALVTVVTAALTALPLRAQTAGVPMSRIESCRIAFTGLAAAVSFAGPVVTYQVTADATGVISTIERTGDPAKLAHFVQVSDFEACVRRWRFGEPGTHQLTLFGGTKASEWRVDVTRDQHKLTVAFPNR